MLALHVHDQQPDAHVRAATLRDKDDSRNSFILAILTLGEGWHNNHHYWQSSTRNGFKWWEFDPTYYTLRALALLGVVWDLKEPPRHVMDGNKVVAAA